MSNPPEAAVWLTIPVDCRMASAFELSNHDEDNIRFTFGHDHERDIHLSFEQTALVRFVDLAQRTLAQPRRSDTGAFPRTMLVANYGCEIQEHDKYAMRG